MIDIRLDIDNPQHRYALRTLFNALDGKSEKEIKGASISEAHSDEAKKVKQIKAKAAEPEAPTTEAEETKAEAPKGGKGITLDMVREAVAEKKDNHFKAMKAELENVYKAPNVTKLDPKDYEDFYNFVKNL